jgi:hypothetical protein
MAFIFQSLLFYPTVAAAAPATNGSIPYFGVTFGGNTTSEAKVLIDKVKGYTNLIIIDNWDVALNETLLNEICQYAVDANLYIIVYFNFIFMSVSQLNASRLSLFTDAGTSPFHISWLISANDKWGDKFLGAYILDEPGGKQIDQGHYSGFTTVYSGRNQTTFVNVTDYSDAANRFARGLRTRYYLGQLINFTYPGSVPNATGRAIPAFTADNALYWFDYWAGYDVVFAELGWNHNEAQHIALCRGAANVQNKDWGAIITWATNDPPYLPTGTQMLQELNTAYDAGANYLIIFNYANLTYSYPQNNPYGALTDEHFKVMEQFWNQIHDSPRNTAGNNDHVALVLPKDYGWGMRQANDRIWGLWQNDSLSPVIGEKVASLTKQYGFNLDIIFDDPHFNYTEKYSTIYYWNGTTTTKPLFNISTSSLYASVAIAAAVLTCVPSYFVIKNKKRRPPSPAFPSSQETIQVPFSSKAVSTTLGNGQLELIDNTIRFHTEKGRLRNRKEITKEIPLTDVENIKQFGDELSVTWKGASDVFVVEEPVLAEEIREKVNVHLEEQRKIEQSLAVMQLETKKTVSVALEIVDSLFDVLRSLQKRFDWKQIESYSKRSGSAGKRLMNQTSGSVNLDFSKLLQTVEKHLPRETSKETYELLRTLHDYFLLASKDKLTDENHLNNKDATKTILAYYTLNDIILSITVGEKDNQKEINQLMTLLESLPNAADLKISISELKGVINKLGTEKEKEDFTGESRMVFRQLLKPLPFLKS